MPEDVRHVVIPDEVTEIENGAFKKCSALQSVTIPDSVTEIGSNAFYGCSSLQSITIPDSVTKIGACAFYGCSAIQSVIIPNGVTEIEPDTFRYCPGLRSVTIPDSITGIGSCAFEDCSHLQSVTIPDSVTKIKFAAFRNCSSFQSVRIPDSVTQIGDRVFEDCSALQSVTIPDSVTKIGRNVFEKCRALRSVAIPKGVTKIENGTFRKCSALQSVTIPDSVTEISDNAFSECSGLQAVTIPDSVTKIGAFAFSYCPGLQSVTIPDSVTEIREFAFEGCSALQSVTIPDSITKIKWGVFSNCSGLQSIVIPDSVTEIGDYAFRGCSGLQSIVIPNSVTEIGDYAFRSCSALQSVTIPDSVTEIGDYVFSRCYGLQSVTIPGSVTEIQYCAFRKCSGLQTVTIPDGVIHIQICAFLECDRLQSLMFKGINLAPYINIDGYGVNTFDVLKALVEHRIPLSEDTVRTGIDMAHQDRLSQWAGDYPVFGTMRLPRTAEYSDNAEKERLQQCFAVQKRTKGRVPEILDKLAMTARICGIPPERLAEAFDIEYTKNLLSEKIPLVPAEACRCYYDRGICNMLIRKEKISVMAEAISLYNRSGHRECYRHLMEFIRSHPDTKTEDLQYAADHAEEIPMRAGTTLTQVRQHRTYTEGLAEVTKIEAEYGKIVPEFRLSDYPCNIEPVGVTYDGMTARVLDLSDDKDIALATRLGELTNCCQSFGKAGETAMMHGFLSPDAGFWVIEDRNREVKAQAEIWKTNNGDLVFDNIEFADTDNEHLTDRADRLRGVIAAWAMESGYTNIIMGCGYNEMGVGSMEQAPVPELSLTPEEIFTLQKNNNTGVSFGNIDEARQYMQSEKYRPNDFVYTDAGKRCVYIKKDGAVSDYLMQGYDCSLAGRCALPGHESVKEQDDDITCK